VVAEGGRGSCVSVGTGRGLWAASAGGGAAGAWSLWRRSGGEDPWLTSIRRSSRAPPSIGPSSVTAVVFGQVGGPSSSRGGRAMAAAADAP